MPGSANWLPEWVVLGPLIKAIRKDKPATGFEGAVESGAGRESLRPKAEWPESDR